MLRKLLTTQSHPAKAEAKTKFFLYAGLSLITFAGSFSKRESFTLRLHSPDRFRQQLNNGFSGWGKGLFTLSDIVTSTLMSTQF